MKNSAFKNLKYIIYPRRCNICGEVIAIDQSLCPDCKNVKRILGKICTKCGKMKVSCDCKNSHHTPSYNAIVSPFVANEQILGAVHRLKFYSRRELAYPMGKEIANTVKERLGDISFDYVTSVPMTKRRLRKRGYNQSQLLAQVVSKELGVPYKTLLKKIFNTKPQRSLSARFRRGNVFGAYDILPNVDVENKCILVIDDIKTTGSTISHCSYLLKIYGADSVYAATYGIR